MMMNPEGLLAVPWWPHWVFGWLFVGICLLLIGIVLLQKGRGGGLSGAFGGASGQSAFGSKTGDVFTYITIVLALLFLGLSVLNNYIFRPLQIDTAPPPAAVTPEEPAGATAVPVDGATDSTTPTGN